MIFDNLPLVDGNRFSGGGVRAGLYPVCGGQELTYELLDYSETEDCVNVVYSGTMAGDMRFTLSPERITVAAEREFEHEYRANHEVPQPSRTFTERSDADAKNASPYRVLLPTENFTDGRIDRARLDNHDNGYGGKQCVSRLTSCLRKSGS